MGFCQHNIFQMKRTIYFATTVRVRPLQRNWCQIWFKWVSVILSILRGERKIERAMWKAQCWCMTQTHRMNQLQFSYQTQERNNTNHYWLDLFCYLPRYLQYMSDNFVFIILKCIFTGLFILILILWFNTFRMIEMLNGSTRSINMPAALVNTSTCLLYSNIVCMNISHLCKPWSENISVCRWNK